MKYILAVIYGAGTTACWFGAVLLPHTENGMYNIVIVPAILLSVFGLIFIIFYTFTNIDK